MTLEVGKFSGVMSDAGRFCFDLVAEGTALEGATLEILQIEARARCLGCGKDFAQETLCTPCQCGARDFERLSLDELLVTGMNSLEPWYQQWTERCRVLAASKGQGARTPQETEESGRRPVQQRIAEAK